MKKTLKSHSKAGPSFEDIVESVPGEVTAFFHKFEAMRDGFALSQEADVLNAVANEEYLACAAGKGPRPTALMKWYEVFRDVFILKSLWSGSRGEGVKKDPNNFTTFARTFEPLAFLPDFWFAADRNIASPGLRGRAHGLRLAFERHLYERDGGGVWGAMDWEMNRFLHQRIFASATARPKDALRRLAALALTARAVAAGELGMYVEERDDVTLPLSGFSNVCNDPNKQNPLLKYYHYDRFTQLSFAREHELAMDPNVPGTHVKFERQWMAMAVLSDVILKESDAHSTHAAATRVMLESVAQCMVKIRAKMRGKESCKAILAVAEKLYDLATRDHSAFAQMSGADLMATLGIKEEVADGGYYLSKCGFSDAADFWEQTLPIFREFEALHNENANRVVMRYTEAQRQASYRDEKSAERFVRDAINKGNESELSGEVGKEATRNTLMSLMLEGSVALQYAVMDDVLTGGGQLLSRRVSCWSEASRVSRALPERFPFAANDAERFREWLVRYLCELSSRCASAKNAEIDARHPRKAGDEKTRNIHPHVKPISYKGSDFSDATDKADRLWNLYFTEDDICRDRWIVSVAEVLRVMDDKTVQDRGNAYFRGNYQWPYVPEMRSGLRIRLEEERDRFAKEGVWPKNIAALEKKLLKSQSYTICDIASARIRVLAMIAVFARLMVHTATVYPELWERRPDLFSLFTHILYATNHSFNRPFPWHLDVASDSYLRLGRSRDRQTNVVDDIVDGEFYDESERTVFIVFVAHYLAAQPPSARMPILHAIARSDSMKAYFADHDLELADRRIGFLRSHFAGGFS